MRSAGDRTPVVVAANKTDLVRTRQVTEDGQFFTLCLIYAGTRTACVYHTVYISITPNSVKRGQTNDSQPAWNKCA